MHVQCEECGRPLFETVEPVTPDNSFFEMLAEAEQERRQREAKERHRFKPTQGKSACYWAYFVHEVYQEMEGKPTRHQMRRRFIRPKKTANYRKEALKAKHRKAVFHWLGLDEEIPF
jgi:hypothetical protein